MPRSQEGEDARSAASSFAFLLRKHRIERGLSQDALAEAAGVSTSAVGAYERGIYAAPHRATVQLLADALMLSPDARADFDHASRRKPRTTGRKDVATFSVNFALPERVTSAAIEICLRLDGMPLTIELAAVRLRVE